MTCKCGKPLMQRLVAVKTQQVGDDVIVMESRDAMVCSEHGVVAWGKPPQSLPPVPYPWINPYPRTLPIARPNQFPPYTSGIQPQNVY